MQYRKEFMPITCGAFNSMPVPYNQGALQPAPQSTSVMGMQQGLPTLPTGVPAGAPFPTAVPGAATVMGAATPGALGAQGGIPASQVPVTVESALFTPGFLRTQIGRRVRVEFMLTNILTDRIGTLIGVGASYILLRLIDSDDIMMCDIYSIRFVTIIL